MWAWEIKRFNKKRDEILKLRWEVQTSICHAVDIAEGCSHYKPQHNIPPRRMEVEKRSSLPYPPKHGWHRGAPVLCLPCCSGHRGRGMRDAGSAGRFRALSAGDARCSAATALRSQARALSARLLQRKRLRRGQGGDGCDWHISAPHLPEPGGSSSQNAADSCHASALAPLLLLKLALEVVYTSHAGDKGMNEYFFFFCHSW